MPISDCSMGKAVLTFCMSIRKRKIKEEEGEIASSIREQQKCRWSVLTSTKWQVPKKVAIDILHVNKEDAGKEEECETSAKMKMTSPVLYN